jgi:hypothetical protein
MDGKGVPMDIRRAVDETMDEVEPGTTLWWRPFTVIAMPEANLGEIHHYKREVEGG